VERADVIVNALDQRDGKSAEVARHLESSAQDASHVRPVVFVTPRSAVAELATSLPHCDVVSGPLHSEAILHVVTETTPPDMQGAKSVSP
jgi:hypothetical protein